MAFRRSTVRFRSAPLPVVVAAPDPVHRGLVQPRQAFVGGTNATRLAPLLLLCAILLLLLGNTGCSTMQPADAYQQESIERPARPLDEEASVFDKAGNAMVAVVVIGVTLVLIGLPLILFL